MDEKEYSESPQEEAAEAAVEQNDDGSVTVKLTPPPEYLPEEIYNLVPHYAASKEGEEFLQKLAESVIKDVADDWESMEGRRKQRKERLKLLVGELDPKNFPFDNCANVHIPLMLSHVLRYVSRLYKEILPSRDYVFTARVPGDKNRDRGEVVTEHMNHQINKEIPDFRKHVRKALFDFVNDGDCFCHVHRDVPAGRNRVEHLHLEEFCFPYVWKTTAPDMSDVPRKTRIIRKYKQELKRLEFEGVLANIEKICDEKARPTFNDGLDLMVSDVVDKIEGRDKPQDEKSAPYVLYDYHGWAKLPGQEEERPIEVIVEPKTRTVAGLYLREEEDPKDRLRFEKEAAELRGFQADMARYQDLVALEEQVRMRISQPDVPPFEAQALQERLMQETPPQPEPPQIVAEGRVDTDPMTGQMSPRPVRMRPIERFFHGTAIDIPDSKSLGLGVGGMIADFNKLANTVSDQFLDAATIANAPPAVSPENAMIDGGDLHLQPGMVHKVRGLPADQVDKAIVPIRIPPANPQLLEMLNIAMSNADQVSSASDVLSGEAGKANETWRGISTRVEQAQVQIGFVGEAFLEFLTAVLRALARLNSVFIEDVEILSVTNPRTLEEQDLEVGRHMYVDDFEIVFTADTTFSSRADKIQKADEILQMATSIRPEIADVIFPPSFVYEAVVRALIARGKHDMVQYLGPRPPVPQAPAGMQPPGPPPGMPPGMPPGAQPPAPGAPPPAAPPPEGPPPQMPPGPPAQA